MDFSKKMGPKSAAVFSVLCNITHHHVHVHNNVPPGQQLCDFSQTKIQYFKNT